MDDSNNDEYRWESSSSSSSSYSSSSGKEKRGQRRRRRILYMMMNEVVVDVLGRSKGPRGGSRPGRRRINWDRQTRHDLIVQDYFSGENSKYPPKSFRRRFIMDVSLFNRILGEIQAHDDYFVQKFDTCRRIGLSPLQKMVASIRILAQGIPAGLVDEYVPIGESTAIELVKHFCDVVIRLFEEMYMRKANVDDVVRLLEENGGRGFPGMLGSLDCMHWHWKNCLVAWQGLFTNGFKKVLALILEVVGSKDLWIWHAFFGMVGSCNDMNVLDSSPLSDNIQAGIVPSCNFEVNGHNYGLGYYLVDGIYPKYATLMGTISHPDNPKEKMFAKNHEVIRKDVERTFGVLQNRWYILKGPTRQWDIDDLKKIMKAVIILHNMIIENEQQLGLDPENWSPPPNESNDNIELEYDQQFIVETFLAWFEHISYSTLHLALKKYLIEHIWNRFGAFGDEES